MGLLFRAMLILGSIITCGFILFKVRRSKVQIEDSIFWIFLSAIVFLLSLFPQIAFFVSDILLIESPVNFIYLVIIFILIVHQFYMTMRISQLNNRIKEVVQRKAIDDYNNEQKTKRP